MDKSQGISDDRSKEIIAKAKREHQAVVDVARDAYFAAREDLELWGAAERLAPERFWGSDHPAAMGGAAMGAFAGAASFEEGVDRGMGLLTRAARAGRDRIFIFGFALLYFQGAHWACVKLGVDPTAKSSEILARLDLDSEITQEAKKLFKDAASEHLFHSGGYGAPDLDGLSTWDRAFNARREAFELDRASPRSQATAARRI